MFKLTVIPQPCKLQAFEGFEILGGGIPISNGCIQGSGRLVFFLHAFACPFITSFFH